MTGARKSGGARNVLVALFDDTGLVLAGETNDWYPDLVEDNHFIEPPSTPEEGCHLSKALVSVVLPGRQPRPHHAPEEYIAKYRGAFDDGCEA